MAIVKSTVRVRVSIPVKVSSSLGLNVAKISTAYDERLKVALNRYKPHGLPAGYDTALQQELLSSATTLLSRVHEYSQLPAPVTQDDRLQLRDQLVHKETPELLDWSKKKGILHDQYEFERLWKEQGSIAGQEQQVVVNPDGRTVTKRKTLLPNETWLDYLNRISIHNKLSPSTAYEFAGMTEGKWKDGSQQVMALVQQPYIEGKGALPHEIESHMYRLGFEKLPNKKFSFYGDKVPAALQEWLDPNSGVVVSDLHAGNVFKLSNGAVALVDPIIEVLHGDRLTEAKDAVNAGQKLPTIQVENTREIHFIQPVEWVTRIQESTRVLLDAVDKHNLHELGFGQDIREYADWWYNKIDNHLGMLGHELDATYAGSKLKQSELLNGLIELFEDKPALKLDLERWTTELNRGIKTNLVKPEVLNTESLDTALRVSESNKHETKH